MDKPLGLSFVFISLQSQLWRGSDSKQPVSEPASVKTPQRKITAIVTSAGLPPRWKRQEKWNGAPRCAYLAKNKTKITSKAPLAQGGAGSRWHRYTAACQALSFSRDRPSFPRWNSVCSPGHLLRLSQAAPMGQRRLHPKVNNPGSALQWEP